MSRMLLGRVVAAVALAAAALVPFDPTAPPAGARSDGACPTSSGVTVVIDFQQLGGGVWVRCAPGAPSSGLQALDEAGIGWTPTVRFADFVCRIEGLPSPSVEPCVNTPPATRYWSYWTAARGGTWTYSNQGGRRTPVPGTVEGWSFSQTAAGETAPPPRIPPPPPSGPTPTAPATVPAPGTPTPPRTPTPTPPTPPTPAAPTAAPSPATPGALVGGAALEPGVAGAAAPTTASPTSEPTSAEPDATDPAAAPDAAGEQGGGSTRSTVLGADGEEIALNAPRRPAPVDTGSPVGTAVALVVVAALGATSFVLRRRRDTAPDLG